MKSIFKKSLGFMMIMFFAVLALSFGNKVKAADETIDWTKASYSSASASNVTWQGESFTISLDKASSQTAANNYLGGTNAHTRIYKGQTLTFTPNDGYTIDSIVITATSSTYAGYFKSTWTNATASSSNTTVTVTPTDGSAAAKLTVGTATRATKIVVNYSAAADTSTVTIDGGDTYTEVGDVLTLTATTANVTGTVAWSSSNTNVATVDQSGNVTTKAFGQTTITASVDEVEDSIELTVYPTDGSELTIAQALQVCQYTGTENCAFEYSVTGVIESIDTAYDAEYTNITVTVTDGNDSIKAYRMSGGEDLVVGDKIKVTGILVNYNGNTPEFVAGCTYEVVADDAATSAIKDALNAIDSYVSAAYKYTKEEVAAPLSVEFVAEELGYENGVAVESISEEPVAIAFAKGENSNAPKYYNTGKAIRCYGGNTMTFTATDTNITSIELTFATGEGTNAISADCGEFDTDTWTGSSATVVLTIGGTTGHRRIASIKVSYEGGSDTKVTQYSDVDFRFKFGVDSDVENIEGVEKVGVSVTAGGDPRFYTSDSFVVDEENGISYIVISLGDIINYSDRASLEFTVSAYVQIGDIKYYSTSSKTYSAKSIIAEYLELGYAVEGLDAIINK